MIGRLLRRLGWRYPEGRRLVFYMANGVAIGALLKEQAGPWFMLADATVIVDKCSEDVAANADLVDGGVATAQEMLARHKEPIIEAKDVIYMEIVK